MIQKPEISSGLMGHLGQCGLSQDAFSTSSRMPMSQNVNNDPMHLLLKILRQVGEDH